ncbi:DUF1761 domain-containing protein [Lactococcus lactis subsp. lactis]|uniref:DUF1761 domain-containing protein n=1 Tax=Lactococcus lactis subsp. lactis TaxID=1360 RepID=A0A2Z3KRF9_LACLL|nr:DUF1761 domain-containing protein [Lactococcus lactis]AWN66943.1 DUF1761 domain-containing protein [Lactococcus lactis subsp. lactis]
MFNWQVTLFGTVAWIIVESLLYNPIHRWGKFWAKESGMEVKMENQTMTTGDMIFTFGGTIIGGILLSSAAYQIVCWFAKNDNDGWLMTSLQGSLLLWLGVYGVATFVMAVYSGQSKKLVGLHLVNGFLGLLVIGLVIGFLR